ncbi:MAG: hypothetical protein ACREBG_25390 [Pyrinomonadaceae bacterium]
MKIGGIWYLRLIALGTTFLVSMLSLSCVMFSRPHRGKDPLETWLTENNAFRIRVTSYEEKDANVSGTYYVFESTAKASTAWHEIMTLRHDDRPDLPKDQIRFLNDETGYLFMEWMYAVTSDSGKTWSVWDATRDVPDWQWSKYGVIRDVRIEPGGSGTMLLKPISDPNSKVPTFRTHDFGRHWQVE